MQNQDVNFEHTRAVGSGGVEEKSIATVWNTRVYACIVLQVQHHFTLPPLPATSAADDEMHR